MSLKLSDLVTLFICLLKVKLDSSDTPKFLTAYFKWTDKGLWMWCPVCACLNHCWQFLFYLTLFFFCCYFLDIGSTLCKPGEQLPPSDGRCHGSGSLTQFLCYFYRGVSWALLSRHTSVSPSLPSHVPMSHMSGLVSAVVPPVVCSLIIRSVYILSVVPAALCSVLPRNMVSVLMQMFDLFSLNTLWAESTNVSKDWLR